MGIQILPRAAKSFKVAVISTAGATSCYMLSRAIGRELARAIWPEKTERFGQEVDRRRQDMLSYIIFLRVTPILPNTFINIASPVVRVPLMPFIAGRLHAFPSVLLHLMI